MCGIVAVFQTKPAITEQAITVALDRIRYRGPDEQSIWCSDNSQVLLGHARLSIIDPSYGQQPLHNKENTLHAVVNGEFYNYKSIRRELCKKGYRFTSHSDSEILIALYQAYGVACLEYLDGEFAFVLYDQSKQLLFAARDRFGVKPLFYTQYNNTLYFASEIKAILALGVPAIWNQSMIITRGMFTEDETFFKSIVAIKPAHYLLADHTSCKALQSINYWQIGFTEEYASTEHSFEIVSQTLVQLLEQSISQRLIADVPVASYLSGGIDSCIVYLLATKLLDKPIPAFTIAFEQKSIDESDTVKHITQQTGGEHHLLTISEQAICQHYPQAVYHAESTLANSNSVARFCLSEYANKLGFKCVLTGDGSDELFAGYSYFQIKTEQDVTIPRILQIQHSLNKQLEAFYTDDYAHQKMNSEFLFYNTLTKLTGDNPSLSGLALSQWVSIKLMFHNYIVSRVGERMDMAHAIETRLPFLDRKVAEFACRLPNVFKYHNGKEKILLNHAFKDLMPKAIVEKQKHGFRGPSANFNNPRSPLNQFYGDILHSEVLGNIPLIDKKKVLTYYQKLPKSSHIQYPIADILLNTIVSLCLLQQQFSLSN